jgi:hypothetical protein
MGFRFDVLINAGEKHVKTTDSSSLILAFKFRITGLKRHKTHDEPTSQPQKLHENEKKD